MINKILGYVDYMKYGKMNNNILHSEYIEFEERDIAKSWGKKYYDDWSQNYKINMKVADKVINTSFFTSCVECYCGYSYRNINEYLRGFKEDYFYKEMSDILAIVLSMAPRVPNNIVVYRLVCDEFIRELLIKNKDEIPTQEKGFISTSLCKDIIEHEDEHYSAHKNVLKIYVKSNTVGIYVNGITKRSEQELLLYPNGFFRLLRRPYKYMNKILYECELLYL